MASDQRKQAAVLQASGEEVELAADVDCSCLLVGAPGEREILPGQADRSLDGGFGVRGAAGNSPAQDLAQRACIPGCEVRGAQGPDDRRTRSGPGSARGPRPSAGKSPRRERRDSAETVTGSSGWTSYEITAQVPADAEIIGLELTLAGPGQVRLRHLELSRAS